MKAMAVGKSRRGTGSEGSGDGGWVEAVRGGSEEAVECERSKVEAVGWVGKNALGDRVNGWRHFEG